MISFLAVVCMEGIPMAYRSELIQSIYDRVMGDRAGREVIRNKLKKVVLTDSHISLVDSVSLGRIIVNYYKLPQDYFEDVYLSDLQALGNAILEQQ